LVKGIAGAKILIVNDYEFEMIKKQTGLSEDEIQKKVETVIITRGEKGSMIRTVERGEYCEIFFPGPRSYRTNAGDAWAGFITAMRRYP
jgi:adenosine kinase